MIGEKQKKILAFPYSRYTALICDGAVRSGKTSLMMVAFVDWAMRCFSNQRFGVCGKTVDSAIKNIIIPYISMTYVKKRFSIKWKRQEKILEIKCNGKINIFEIFGGKDESSFALIQGRTLAGVLIDEVVLMPRSFVEQALTRCSVEGSRFWFSCNPGSPKHWFYEEWILQKKEKNALYLHFEMRDNPSLSDEILERYDKMFQGVFHQRYVQGLWVLAEGLVYPNFDEKEQCFDVPPFMEDGKPKKGTEFYISIDYGIVNPFAAYLWAIYDGVAYCWKEYYFDSRKKKRQKTDEEHYKAVEDLTSGFLISDVVIDPSATSFKETINRHGRFYTLNAKNDVINGIAVVSTLLECGRVKIHRSCENLIKEFGLYSWDEDAKQDSVIKENDHGMDSIRYFAFTVLRREFDWIDWGDKD